MKLILILLTLVSPSSFAQIPTPGMMIEVKPCSLNEVPKGFHLQASNMIVDRRFINTSLKRYPSSKDNSILNQAKRIFEEHLTEWFNFNQVKRTSDWFYYPQPALPYSPDFFSKYPIKVTYFDGQGMDQKWVENTFTFSKEVYTALMNAALTPVLNIDNLYVNEPPSDPWENQPLSALPLGKIKLTQGVELKNLNTLAMLCGQDPSTDGGSEPFTYNSPNWIFRVNKNSSETTLLEIRGLANRDTKNIVEAQIDVSLSGADIRSSSPSGYLLPRYTLTRTSSFRASSVYLAIETYDETQSTWKMANFVVGTGQLRIQTEVPQGAIFRARLFTNFGFANHPNEGNFENIFIGLKRALVFGAQCYPDLANPGKCL